MLFVVKAPLPQVAELASQLKPLFAGKRTSVGLHEFSPPYLLHERYPSSRSPFVVDSSTELNSHPGRLQRVSQYRVEQTDVKTHGSASPAGGAPNCRTMPLKAAIWRMKMRV